jgi:hypothetical protein
MADLMASTSAMRGNRPEEDAAHDLTETFRLYMICIENETYVCFGVDIHLHIEKSHYLVFPSIANLFQTQAIQITWDAAKSFHPTLVAWRRIPPEEWK